MFRKTLPPVLFGLVTIMVFSQTGPVFAALGFSSDNLTEIDFSVDNDFAPNTPVGLKYGDVYNEEQIPEDAHDDFYLTSFPSNPLGPNSKTFDENVPAHGSGFTPALNFGTDNATDNATPENTDAYCFAWGWYTIEYDWRQMPTILEDELWGPRGPFALQFTVDTTAQGIWGTAVWFEATKNPTEAAGDVFEAPNFYYGNSLIADEATLGLEDSPLDDTNSLVVPDYHLQGGWTPTFGMLNYWFDTDGDQALDAPWIFFSVKNGGGASTQAGISGADILQTAPYNGGNPAFSVAWTAGQLGLDLAGYGTDELDALYIEDPDAGAGGPYIYFSLAANSTSLSDPNVPPNCIIDNPFNGGCGADPGDVIAVIPGPAPGIPPSAGPQVVIRASALGLNGDQVPGATAGDDDLNGLHLTVSSVACSHQPAKNPRLTTEYSHIWDAYNDPTILNGDTIQAQAGGFIENLVFGQNLDLTLKGGYDCTFAAQIPGDYTTIADASGGLSPTMRITNGTLIVENVRLR